MEREITELINDYARVYSGFEQLQKDGTFAGGDQKTGVLAEYYAKLYIENVLSKGQLVEYASSGSYHDLKYVEKERSEPITVQVKAVSAHSKTRTISPIRVKYKNKKTGEWVKSFDKLYLISLDMNFLPNGFWVMDFEAIEAKILEYPSKRDNPDESKRWKIEGAFMKGEATEKTSSGSRYLDFSEPRINGLLKALVPDTSNRASMH